MSRKLEKIITKKNIFIATIIALLLSILLISGCSREPARSGGVYPRPIPKRIVSLGPVITEELYLLGAGDKLIANTIYCEKPDGAKNKEKIGTVTKVNMEKIVSLNPDLVLATGLTKPSQIEKLKSLGIEVLIFSIYKNKNFFQICEQFIELGKVVDKHKQAEKIVRRAKEKIVSIQKRIKGKPAPKVLVQIGSNPLWVATKDSFINDFIALAGGINIGPSGKSGLYSREKVLEQNPDVIIIVTMGITGIKEKKIWQKYKTLAAAKNNRIHIVDSYKVCSPTPLSFIEALQEITEILHPQIKLKKKKDD